jgi:hypothetical protein
MSTMVHRLALVLAVGVLAACGDDDEPVGESVPVERFNERAASSNEPWTRSPDRFAAEFLRIDEREGEGLEVSFEQDDEELVVTLDRLSDDSVRAERYALVLERQEDGSLRLVSAHRTWRCWERRGHQDFSTELCI